MMKALVFHGINDMRLAERDVPAYGPNDVLIRVKACGICHTDHIILSGGAGHFKFPMVAGHELGGLVAACGEGVRHVKEGDRVTVNTIGSCGHCRFCHIGEFHRCEGASNVGINHEGGFQEYVALPGSFVYKIPDTMSFDKAAMVEPAANAYGIVDQSQSMIGDFVAVVGPGPIGLAAVSCASLRQPGLLIAVGTREERLQLAGKLGATHTVNTREADAYDGIMRITGGRGVDVVHWCGGERDAWDLSRRITAKYGKLMVEACPSEWNAEWPVLINDFNNKMNTYVGARGYTPRQYEETIELIRAGHVDVNSLITHRFALEDYEEAFATSRERRGGAIKVMFNL